MNEGQRHEKAAIVAVSYMIGFTAAFLLFANFGGDKEVYYPTVALDNSASVINATAPAAVVTPVAVPVAPVAVTTSEGVTYTDGLLQVDIDDQAVLLSFNPTNSGINADISTMSQGFHYGNLVHAVSPDQKFVFFCENHVETAKSCSGYVYDINADRIYPIVKNGSQPLISASSAATIGWVSEGLKIGSNYSASPTAPWVLIGE